MWKIPGSGNRRLASSAAMAILALGLLLAIPLLWAPESGDSGRDRVSTEAPHNCRFWGIISAAVPSRPVERHLIKLPRSIERLSASNRDGWGLVHFPAGSETPVLRRGKGIAQDDPHFDEAVAELLGARARIAIAHVRYCSSGLCDIPNPHPFSRELGGRHWFMGHNGTIPKDVLLELLSPEFLASHPPQVGECPEEWIDSELYFLYILESCEAMGWRVEDALGKVVQNLRHHIPGEGEQLNIVLSDGVNLWAYREGISLYLLHRPQARPPFSAVASQYPSLGQEDWTALADGELAILSETEAPRLRRIEEYFPRSLSADAPLSDQAEEQALELKSAESLAGRVRIAYRLAEPAQVDLEIFDVSGRRLRILAKDARQGEGEQRLLWDGRDDAGRRLAVGVYLYRLETAAVKRGGKLLLIR